MLIMKKIVPILIALLLIIGAIILVLSNNDKTSNDKQTDKQEQKEQESKDEQEGYPTIKMEDGQLFIMKQDGLIYCRLGEDKDGNIIEVKTLNEECVINEETCKILLEEGTTLLKENPTYLEQCK